MHVAFRYANFKSVNVDCYLPFFVVFFVSELLAERTWKLVFGDCSGERNVFRGMMMTGMIKREV